MAKSPKELKQQEKAKKPTKREKLIAKYTLKIRDYKGLMDSTKSIKVKSYYQKKYIYYTNEVARIKNEDNSEDEYTFFFKLKRWFFGVGKEFLRIDWTTKTKVFISFAIIIIIVGLLASIFLLIDYLII